MKLTEARLKVICKFVDDVGDKVTGDNDSVGLKLIDLVDYAIESLW